MITDCKKLSTYEKSNFRDRQPEWGKNTELKVQPAAHEQQSLESMIELQDLHSMFEPRTRNKCWNAGQGWNATQLAETQPATHKKIMCCNAIHNWNTRLCKKCTPMQRYGVAVGGVAVGGDTCSSV